MRKSFLAFLAAQALRGGSRHTHAAAQEVVGDDNKRESDIRQKIEAEVLQRGATFETLDPNNPRRLALDWMLRHDDLRLDSEDESLTQRYTLALLAFALDSLAWYNCGDHRNSSNTSEYYVREDCEVQLAQRPEHATWESHKVWLSSTEECEWYGVICGSGGVVRGVELSESFAQYRCREHLLRAV